MYRENNRQFQDRPGDISETVIPAYSETVRRGDDGPIAVRYGRTSIRGIDTCYYGLLNNPVFQDSENAPVVKPQIRREAVTSGFQDYERRVRAGLGYMALIRPRILADDSEDMRRWDNPEYSQRVARRRERLREISARLHSPEDLFRDYYS